MEDSKNTVNWQIAKYQTSKKLMELVDKLKPTTPQYAPHIHAGRCKETDGNHRRLISCIGVRLLDYSTGTGEKNAINLLFEHCSKINKIIACPFDNSGFPLGWSCGDCSEKMSHSTSCFHKDKFDIFPDGTRKNKPAWETFPRSQK